MKVDIGSIVENILILIMLRLIASISYLEIPLTLWLSYYNAHLFSFRMLLPCILLYVMKECYSMSVCLHRYFSHRAFKCNRSVQFCLSFLGCLASQGSPLWWASKHRRHHKHCDTPRDPHSPHAYTKMYAWIGWIYTEGPCGSGTDFEYIKDFDEYPELYLFEIVPWAPVSLIHYLFYRCYGFSVMLYVSMWSSILCQLLTLYFNVISHSAINDERCKAVDNPGDILSNIYGESYHKHHHKHPRLAKRPGIDIPYWTFILPMLYLNLFRLDKHV